MVDFSSCLDLSVDIWVSIYHRLDKLLDRLFFSSVCSLFRSISSSIEDDPIRLSKALLLIIPSPNNSQTTHQFFSLTNNKLYSCSIPELQGKWLCGSSNGWLLTMGYLSHTGDMNLFNPLTRSQISLPSSIDFYSPLLRKSSYYHESDKILCLGKFTMSHTEDGFMVMAVFPYLHSFAFYRTGDSKWTFIDWHSYQLQDVMYYNGMFYAIDCMGYVFAWRINAYKKRRIGRDITSHYHTISRSLGGFGVYPARSRLYRFYLVESLTGELMKICRLVDSDLRDKDHRDRFIVHKLDEHKSWITLHSLGDQSLFLGSNQSICLSSLDHPEFEADCVYFTDEGNYLSPYAVNDVGVYSLKNQTVQPFYPNQPLWTNGFIWITPPVRRKRTSSVRRTYYWDRQSPMMQFSTNRAKCDIM